MHLFPQHPPLLLPSNDRPMHTRRVCMPPLPPHVDRLAIHHQDLERNKLPSLPFYSSILQLGRPWRVELEKLEALLSDETNPVREKPYRIQARVNGIPLASRSLQYNMVNRLDSQLFLAAYSDNILPANKKKREAYGQEHKDEPLFGYWDGIHLIDEAHFNPTEDFQEPKLFSKRGERTEGGNLRTRKKKKKKDPRTLHFYASVNWYYKSDLSFYNNDKNMLPVPKPPRKPHKSKY
jgi:hypothetical protein